MTQLTAAVRFVDSFPKFDAASIVADPKVEGYYASVGLGVTTEGQ